MTKQEADLVAEAASILADLKSTYDLIAKSGAIHPSARPTYDLNGDGIARMSKALASMAEKCAPRTDARPPIHITSPEQLVEMFGWSPKEAQRLFQQFAGPVTVAVTESRS